MGKTEKEVYFQEELYNLKKKKRQHQTLGASVTAHREGPLDFGCILHHAHFYLPELRLILKFLSFVLCPLLTLPFSIKNQESLCKS